MVIDHARAFPPAQILVESWQGVASAQALERLGLPVTITTPTPKSNAEEWTSLAQLLRSRRIVTPANPELREELLGLSYDLTPSGIRVVDRGKAHQDRSVAIRMIAHHLAQAPKTPAMVW